jgi:hypothetical protein
MPPASSGYASSTRRQSASCQTDLTLDLRQELQRLALPLTSYIGLSDAELRIAHARLVGSLKADSRPCSPPCPARI